MKMLSLKAHLHEKLIELELPNVVYNPQGYSVCKECIPPIHFHETQLQNFLDHCRDVHLHKLLQESQIAKDVECCLNAITKGGLTFMKHFTMAHDGKFLYKTCGIFNIEFCRETNDKGKQVLLQKHIKKVLNPIAFQQYQNDCQRTNKHGNRMDRYIQMDLDDLDTQEEENQAQNNDQEQVNHQQEEHLINTKDTDVHQTQENTPDDNQETESQDEEEIQQVSRNPIRQPDSGSERVSSAFAIPSTSSGISVR